MQTVHLWALSLLTAVSALMPFPVGAQSAGSRFDLTCAGFTFIGETKDLLDVSKQVPVRLHYKIDLEKKRWCSGTCHETFPIQSATSKMIVFKSEDYGRGDDMFNWVDRETGILVERMRLQSIGSIVVTKADCTAEAFSGFPIQKF